MERKPLTRLEAGLPASWYRDPAHYARELEAFWYRNWIAVAREEELPAPGDWRMVRIGTQALVITRGEAGELRAFHNTCRHRGSVLCTEERGNLARDAPPLAEALGALPERFARYRLPKLRIGKRIVAEVRANWKLVAENFSECFHCPPVHPELCRVVTAYRDAGAWGLRGPEAAPEYASGAQTLTLDGSARLPAIGTLNDEERRTLYIPAMLPPALFLNVHPDYVNAHMMTPTGPESVRIVYDWLFEPERLPLSEADLQHYVALSDITNRQDAQNCEWQQQGIHSGAFQHGYYVPQEFDCHRFAQWVRAGLAREVPAEQPERGEQAD